MLPSLATRQQGQLAEIQIPALGRLIFHTQTGALSRAGLSLLPSLGLGLPAAGKRRELWQWPRPYQRWLRDAHGDMHRSL